MGKNHRFTKAEVDEVFLALLVRSQQLSKGGLEDQAAVTRALAYRASEAIEVAGR